MDPSRVSVDQVTGEWRSSVLRCHPQEDGCDICAFLDGSRERTTLMEVIRILDAKLADRERVFTGMVRAIAKSK